MSESHVKILEMLSQGKISVEDANRLLGAIGATDSGRAKTGPEPAGGKANPKYLRVTVTPGEEGSDAFHNGHTGRVNVRVPMSLVRAGIKLTSLIPPEALDKANHALREKGINFDVRDIKMEDLEELIAALGDMQIDVEGNKGEKVKVFVE